MPRSRVEFFKDVLENSEGFCSCRPCIEDLAIRLDEAAANHRAQYRGDRMSAVDELKSTPEGLAAYNRARAESVVAVEVRDEILAHLQKIADDYDALTITHQERTAATILQIKREAVLDAMGRIRDGI